MDELISKAKEFAKKHQTKLIIIALLLAISAVGLIINKNKDTKHDKSSSVASSSSQTEIINAEVTKVIEETQAETSLITEAISTEAVPHRTGDNIIGISDKSFAADNINVSFDSSVHNDATGNYRLARISDSINIEDYALDYYRNYFTNNNEVHFIINFTYNTTTVINCSSGILYVTTHEHIKDEEHDAKKIGGGMTLTSYAVYTDNGDIEKM